MDEHRVKRKLTTILEADVAGYSRMMAEDEEHTLATLDIFRELMAAEIARHDGRIVGTAGDAMLAEFDSAVEAVRCAISIQENLSARNAELSDERRMLLRICHFQAAFDLYRATRRSACALCPAKPSSAQSREQYSPIIAVASGVTRWYVQVLMNLPTQSPPV